MAGARSRNFEGWPLFANSFRPFFLFAAIQAAVSILAWLPMLYGELSVTSAFAPRGWHVHEMLYGFLPAVITGFLFTAIPNWTGRLPIQGTSLAALLVVWLAGRLAVTLSAEIGWMFALLVDAAFLALVVAAAAREIIAGGNWRTCPWWCSYWCFLPATSPFISKRTSKGPRISASASVSAWSWC